MDFSFAQSSVQLLYIKLVWSLKCIKEVTLHWILGNQLVYTWYESAWILIKFKRLLKFILWSHPQKQISNKMKQNSIKCSKVIKMSGTEFLRENDDVTENCHKLLPVKMLLQDEGSLVELGSSHLWWSELVSFCTFPKKAFVKTNSNCKP